MTEAQIQLQNALTTTFLANLAFLSEYDNELYHRVDELSRMIEIGNYEEKYALEFIMESGDFDIYDILNNTYIYNKNPKKINDELVRKVKFDAKNAIFYVGEYFLFKTAANINREKRFDYEYLGELTLLTQNDMFQYADILKDFLDNKNKKIKDIKKFIFLGTLLGRHIPKIAEKIDAKMYLVLERNLEIFRLSLFTVDYTILANNGVMFSIMENPVDEEKKIRKFLDIGFLDNYLLKFSTTNINIENYVDKILISLLINKPTHYDYNRRLYTHINRTTKVLNSEYDTLMVDKIKNNFNFFGNIPILYIAAGPSLDQNIKWIEKNQNKFFIVCIGRVCKKLLRNNIRVDIVTTLDEQEFLATTQFDNETVDKINKNTIVLASTITNEKILRKFNLRNLFLYEVFYSLHKKNLAFGGFSIGEVTLDILLKMNAKEIYLIGLDLALNQVSGETHANGINSTNKIDLNQIQNRGTFNDRKSLIKVKGNFDEEIFTTSLFYNSIKSLEGKILKEDKTVNIYNLSTHGAYFENTIPTQIDSINMNNFKEIEFDNKILLKLLSKYSRNSLSISSKNQIIKEINFLKGELNSILIEIEKKEFRNYEDFDKEIFLIMTTIQKQKFKSIYLIIIDFFSMLIPYLSYHFNDKILINEFEQVRNIKKIIIRQMQNIINDYILCLDRLTK